MYDIYFTDIELLTVIGFMCFFIVQVHNLNINYCVRGGHKPARWPWPTSPMPYTCPVVIPDHLTKFDDNLCPLFREVKGVIWAFFTAHAHKRPYFYFRSKI